jgi:hypothetical protein
MFKDNLIFGYVLFVGVPLLILIGVLRAGAGLSAPAAVSGDWTVEAGTDKCAASLAGAGQPMLKIYQTGTDLLITFNDPRNTTFAGKIAGGRIAAVSSRTGCGAASRLEAALTGKPGHRSLEGRILFDGCNACAPVPFHAAQPGK